jgi:AAA domain/Bifunctional DNA primase/polymerase, N-terminal
MYMTFNVVLNKIHGLVENPVILPIPYGTKAPKLVGWEKLTFEQTQQMPYQRELIRAVGKGGNLGIRLGKHSGGLTTIDIDRDELVEPFLVLNPELRKTLRTRGGKGCQLWFYPTGDYPADDAYYSIKEAGGDKVGEFRVGGGDKGAQSVCYGWHPTANRFYEMEVEAKPIRFDFSKIVWPVTWILPWKIGGGGGGQTDKEKFEDWAHRHPNWILKGFDLVGLFKKLGRKVEKTEGENKWAVQCPWAKEHTMDSGELQTVIYQHPGQRPDFVCLHSHCKDDHKLLEVLEWAEEQRPGLVEKCNLPKAVLPPAVEYSGIITGIKLPPYVIVGLLHQMMKLMLTAPGKMRKSWLIMDLALQLALGGEWLGFDTCQSRVLILNMEMPQVFFEWRLQQIQKARKIDNGMMVKGALNALHMRGSYALDGSWEPLAKLAKDEGYQVIIIDPIYKTLGARDENSAKDIANLLRNVDVVAEASGAAIIEVHHNAKGDYTQKEVGDRASGSGVFFRDPDAFMTMGYANANKLYDEAKIEVRARMVPPIEPIGIRWNMPLWTRDDSVSLEEVVGKSFNKLGETKTQGEIMLDLLKDHPEGLTYTQWLNLVEIPKDSFNKALKRANVHDKIFELNEKYYVKGLM